MPTTIRTIQNREVRRIVRCAFYSRMQFSEVLHAGVANGCWYLADTKNGEPRIVLAHPHARSAAECRGKKPAKITVQAYFREAARSLGFTDLPSHDLRHPSASEMINAGVDLYTVGTVLGRKDARSTKRYSHLAASQLAAALETSGKKSPPPTKRKAA